MVPSSMPEDRRARGAFVWIAVIVVVLAAALTGAWYFLANRLDVAVRAAIETAGGQGVEIACGNQSVFGYPFRLGLHCDTLGIDAPDKQFKASAGTLRTAAQIYQPTKLVAELDGPLSIAAEGAPPLDIRWRLAQASAHFWTEGLDRFALVMDAPVIAVGTAGALQPMAQSAHVEAHARRRDDALDLAVSDSGIKVLAPSLAALPAFDAMADVTIEGAANWLSGRRPGRTLGEALAGKNGTIRTLRVAIAGAPAPGADALGSAEISGPFQVSGDGTISGAFDLVVTDPKGIADLVARLVPKAAGIAGSVASGISFAGKTENDKTTIRITVEDGKASLGVIPLGTIPRLQ